MKRLLFTVCFVLSLGTAFGQNSIIVTEQNIHDSTKYSIIKEYRYPSTISCIQSDYNSSTFIYADQSVPLHAKEFTVPDLRVNDMIIKTIGVDGKRDTVYFCGRNLRNGLATFGYFSVNDVFNGSGTVYLHNPFLSGEETLQIENLTRMVTFVNETGTHYACIGTNENGKHCLVDLACDPFSNTWDYRAGTLIDGLETMFDIKKVYSMPRDYIVTSGIDSSMDGKYLSLRVYDPSDVFAASGIQDIKHVFCIDTSFCIPWEKEDVLASNPKNNYIVTVSYIKSSAYYQIGQRPWPSQSSLHIGVFNINMLVSGSLNSMVDNTVFEPLYFVDNNLNWLVEGPENTLAFLETETHTAGYKTSAFSEVDFDASHKVCGIRLFQTPEEVYYGMDSYNVNRNYVISGFKKDNRTMLRFGMETFMSSKSCHPTDKYDFIHRNPYKSVNRTRPFVIKYRRSEFEGIRVFTDDVPQETICEQ